MSRFISLLKNIRRGLRMAFAFTGKLTFGLFSLALFTNLAPLLQAKILGSIVNSIVSTIRTSHALNGITFLVLAYAGVYGGIRVLNALDLYLTKTWRAEMEHGLEITLLKKRSEIDLGHYENPEFQNLLQRATYRSIWPVYEITEAQFQTLGNIAVIAVSSIITSVINWRIYVIVMLSSIPSYFVQLKYGYKVWGLYAEHSPRQRKYLHMRSHLIGRIGVTQAKILQSSKRILEHINEALEAFKSDTMKLDRRRFIFQSSASIIAASGFGFSLFLISKDVLAGAITVGSMVFIISALGSLVGSINQVLSQLATQLEKSLYATDIFAVLDTKPYIVVNPHPIPLSLSLPPTIQFHNVSFKYEGRKDWILQDINLTINPGEKVALVGMNGAGKTTLVKLLSRIYDPTEGDIFINGVNLKDVDPQEWTSYLSVLLQDYLSYDLPVKESIAMSKTSVPVDLEKVKQAAEYSGANEFIESWENSYDQQLGKEFDEGIEPSKGQQQKLALARTIYRDSLVMILDEPTAAIDALSEMKIFQAMERAVGKNTLIVITHRFNTTQSLDKIIVLDKGCIAEIGSHKELIEYGGLYKEMFDSQASAFKER